MNKLCSLDHDVAKHVNLNIPNTLKPNQYMIAFMI